MSYKVSEVLSEDSALIKMIRSKPQSRHRQQQPHRPRNSHYKNVMGGGILISPSFKIKVLDFYHYDEKCKLNERATTRKFNIHRHQLKKWLENEETLRESYLYGVRSASSEGVATSSASPSQDQPSLVHLYHPQSSEPTPASSALSVKFSRLQIKSEPPPSASPSSCSSSSLTLPSEDEHYATTSPIPSKATQALIPVPRSHKTQMQMKRGRSDEEDGYEEHFFIHPKRIRRDSCRTTPNHVDYVPEDSLPLSADSCSILPDSQVEKKPCEDTKNSDLACSKPSFKIKVLNTMEINHKFAKNRTKARKVGINRHKVKKWMMQEEELMKLVNVKNIDNFQRSGPVPETKELAGDSLSEDTEPTVASMLTPPNSSSSSCCPDVPEPYYSSPPTLPSWYLPPAEE